MDFVVLSSKNNDALDAIRRNSTFDHTSMQLFLEDQESTIFKKELYDLLESDPIFQRSWETHTMLESRRLNEERWRKLLEYDIIRKIHVNEDLDRFYDMCDVLETYDQGLAAKALLCNGMFLFTLMSLGSEKHGKLVQLCKESKIVGCFCLTEIAQGSNIKGIRTECRLENSRFVLHTPDDEATKCWAGNLSHSATHAIVFARLITADGVCHAVHAFCIRIRDPVTMKPFEGIEIGDMHEKPGSWNGVDNGWMKFDRLEIPLMSLLDRFAFITPDGEFIDQKPEARSEQLACQFSMLSFGRVGVVGKGALAARLAAVISVRYSAARKQISEKSGPIALLEFPLQTKRVIPILSTAIVLTIFNRNIRRTIGKRLLAAAKNNGVKLNLLKRQEVHALTCASKAVSTTLGVEALREARLACGGHGFLKCSRLNDLIDSFDPTQTYEGDNNVILQQTADILLNFYKRRGELVFTQLESLVFLSKTPTTFTKWTSTNYAEDILLAYEWLMHYHLESISSQSHIKSPEEQCHIRHQLAIAYAEYTIISNGLTSVKDAPEHLMKVLKKAFDLFALMAIQKHIGMLYIGGFCEGSQWGETVRNALYKTENDLKPYAIALTDVLSPPDFHLHSVLGMYDGKIYENLMREFRKK